MQRVSIGRAIVRKLRVFPMVVPLSALDAKPREALRIELKSIQMNLGAIFCSSPTTRSRWSIGDKIGVLNARRSFNFECDRLYLYLIR